MLQYGRQNIENVKKRNGTRDPDVSVEEERGSPMIPESNSTVSSSKMQNGSVGNTVIARSKDLILVPQPEMQNHKNHIEETKLKNDHETSTIAGKEVNKKKICLYLSFTFKHIY